MNFGHYSSLEIMKENLYSWNGALHNVPLLVQIPYMTIF